MDSRRPAGFSCAGPVLREPVANGVVRSRSRGRPPDGSRNHAAGRRRAPHPEDCHGGVLTMAPEIAVTLVAVFVSVGLLAGTMTWTVLRGHSPQRKRLRQLS